MCSWNFYSVSTLQRNLGGSDLNLSIHSLQLIVESNDNDGAHEKAIEDNGGHIYEQSLVVGKQLLCPPPRVSS